MRCLVVIKKLYWPISFTSSIALCQPHLVTSRLIAEQKAMRLIKLYKLHTSWSVLKMLGSERGAMEREVIRVSDEITW